VDSWGKLVYNWPGDTDFLQRVESQWYIYWMQNMPGLNNRIPHIGNELTNWWQFTAQWDLCLQNSIGLYGPKLADDTVVAVTESHEAIPEIMIYPNPAESILVVELPRNGKLKSVIIYGADGKLIDQSETYDHEITLGISNYSKGTYYVKVRLENYEKHLRFVKKRS
jgi:hypothetical protein